METNNQNLDERADDGGRSSQTDRRPAKRIHVSGGVSLSAWRNEGTRPDGSVWESYNVTIQRAYKTGTSDEWKYTSSLRVRDLLPAAMALQEFYRQVCVNDGVKLAQAAATSEEDQPF